MSSYHWKKILLLMLGTVALIPTIIQTAQAAAVIQEVLYDGPGTDSDDVFTELFGDPGTDLNGWSLVAINGNDGSIYRTIDLTGQTIPVDGVFVLTTASANADLISQSDMIANVDWQNGPDALQLFNGIELVDALQYGDAGMFNAGEGGFAEDISGDFSLSRDLFGTDSNNNAIDFNVGVPTPGIGPAVVPIPAAGWLFGSTFALLGWFRSRNNNLLCESTNFPV